MQEKETWLSKKQKKDEDKEIWLLIANDVYDQDAGDVLVGYTTQKSLTKIYLKEKVDGNYHLKIQKVECLDEMLKELDVEQNGLIKFK